MSKKRNKSIRKILAVSMAAAICAGTGLMTPVGNFIGTNTVVSAAETYNDFEYEINNDNTIAITKYTGSASDVSIPSKIDGKSVTSIEQYAFDGCTGSTSIKIPESVTSIREGAFRGCTGLTDITIPDSVTSIERFAFEGCTGLTSITIPESVTLIEQYAFNGCTGLTGIAVKSGNKDYSSQNGVLFNKDKTQLVAYPAGKQGGYTIPDSVTLIGEGAFYSCTGLTSIILPDSVTSIKMSTFRGCTGLTSVTIPDGVTSIERFAFSACTGLTSIKIPNSVTSIDYFTFSNGTELTIHGEQGSYAQTYAKLYGKPFVAAFFNHSSVSADEINHGGTVTVNANASGGNGDYTYAVLYKKTTNSKWIIKQNYKANANVSIKPETSGTYDICVKVKDGNGDIEKKYFTVKVLGELENNSKLSATEITLGDTITATAQGEGGTGEYTYAVLYKKKSDTKWTVKQNYNTNSTVTIKPAHSVEYDVCIKVKDGDGNIAKKYFTVNVKKPALANSSAVSSSSITLGNTVTVKATATGGKTPYTYAVYTKKSTTYKWTENQAYSTNSSVNFKPTAKGTYDICVKVKDKSGTIEKKYLTVTVK